MSVSELPGEKEGAADGLRDWVLLVVTEGEGEGVSCAEAEAEAVGEEEAEPETLKDAMGEAVPPGAEPVNVVDTEEVGERECEGVAEVLGDAVCKVEAEVLEEGVPDTPPEPEERSEALGELEEL